MKHDDDKTIAMSLVDSLLEESQQDIESAESSSPAEEPSMPSLPDMSLSLASPSMSKPSDEMTEEEAPPTSPVDTGEVELVMQETPSSPEEDSKTHNLYQFDYKHAHEAETPDQTRQQDHDEDKTATLMNSGLPAESMAQIEESQPAMVPTMDAVDDEATQKLTVMSGGIETPDPAAKSASAEVAEDVRFGRVITESSKRPSVWGGVAEASLIQSENLRVAQQRILELEKEVERLRRENEQLMAAGETLRRKSDDLQAQLEKSNAILNEEKQNFKEERHLLNESVRAKSREVQTSRDKIAELEMRLENDLRKIRVRERELENRLELTKMEEAALIRNKDDIILDLKRRMDQLAQETDNYRQRSRELNNQMNSDQEKVRRTVRALRLALAMLEDESGEGAGVALKKAE